jgi:hypothetical protein
VRRRQGKGEAANLRKKGKKKEKRLREKGKKESPNTSRVVNLESG